jgi:DNA-binding FadR family transcriptional regulator
MTERSSREPVVGDSTTSHHQGGAKDQSLASKIEQLGLTIVAGVNYQAGDIVTLETIGSDLGVTRAQAREVVQTLSAKGLLGTQPRVGSIIQSLDKWDVLDEDVVRWRLAAERTHPQMRSRTDHQIQSIMELRLAVEPAATSLAARRAPRALCGDLIGLAYRLKSLGSDEERFKKSDDHRREYRDIDARFHTAILEGSQNELFKAVRHVVLAAMDHRINSAWAGAAPKKDSSLTARRGEVFPLTPEPVALWFHVFVAHAVDQQRPRAAHAFSRGLLAEIDDELLTDEKLRADINDALYEVRLDEPDRKEFKEQLNLALNKARIARQGH